MPGLLETGMGRTTIGKIPGLDELAEVTPVGYEADIREVDPTKETTAGQLQGLLDSASPYIQRARTRAGEAANARGLLNSTMGVQAGEAAAIDAALPIAASDAGVYGTAALTNQAARNTALGYGATASNQASALNAAAGNQAARMSQSGQQTSLLSAQQAGEQTALTTLQGELQSQLTRQTGLQQQSLARLQDEIQTGQINTQADLNARLQAERSQQQIAEQAAAAGQQRQTLAQAGTQDIALQTLRGQQATMLSDVEAQYKTLIQSSASAAESLNTINKVSAAILADTNTTVEQKQAAMNTMAEWLKINLTVIGAIGDIDLVGLLEFTPEGV